MKTIFVHGPSGRIAAEQLATFAAYVQNVQYRFVVVKLPGDNSISLTHRHSGKRVTTVSHTSVIAALNDYSAAGKSALDALIKQHGEARIASVLRTAELDPALSQRAERQGA